MDGYLRWTNLDLERHGGFPLENCMDRRSLAAHSHWGGLRHGAGALGLRHERPTGDYRSQGHSQDEIKPGCTTEGLRHVARQRGADCGADAAEGSDDTLAEVVSSRALRYVGDDQGS